MRLFRKLLESSADEIDESGSARGNDSARSHCERGFWLLSCECPGEAMDQFKLAIRSDTRYADGHYGLGLCYSRLGSKRKAIGEYHRAIELSPEHCEARNGLAEEHIATGETLVAMKELVAALRIRPQLILTHLNLANLYYTMGSYAEATKAASKALLSDPKCPRAHYILGLVYIDLQDRDNAVIKREILDEIDPDSAHLLQREIDREFVLNRARPRNSHG